MNVYEDLRPLRSRLAWWRALVVILFAGLVLRFWQLQVVRSTTYDELARANHVRPIPESAPRGLIVDRYGSIIAENRPSFNLTLEEERPDTLVALKALVPLGDPDFDVTKYLREARLDAAILKEDIPLEEVARVEARQLELPGAHIQFVPRRYYPAGMRAAHLVGYVGRMTEEQLQEKDFAGADRNDYVGQSGVERIYNELLMGRNGVQRVVVNSLGRRERVLDQVPPVWGESVQLSIDLELQRVAEEAFEGFAGSVVALDPRNGEVLVMGSFPAYDPNFFSGRFERKRWLDLVNDSEHPLSNRAIQGRYAPGSTFKPVTALAGLESGAITPATTIEDRGSYRVGGRTFRNAQGRAYGRVDLVRALAVSSDVYFYNLAERLHTDRDGGPIQAVARRVGFGRATGLDVGPEGAGRVPEPSWRQQVHDRRPGAFPDPRWYPGDSVNLAIGQGDLLVTPLQIAAAYAALGTGTAPPAPRLIAGPVADPAAPPGPPLFDPGARAAVLQGLAGAVAAKDGTAAAAFAGFPVPVAGKTGTAQVAGKSDTGLFAGLLPAAAPRYAVVAVVEEAGFGSVVAAPIVRKVMEALLVAGTRP